MKRVTHYAAKIPRSEWDFSKVPVDQLEACFAWEYAREWELLRSGSPLEAIPSKPSSGGKNPDYEQYQADPDRWVGCVRADVIADFRDRLNTPWQELPSDIRAEMTQRRGECPGLVELEPKSWEFQAGFRLGGRQREQTLFKTVAFRIDWDHNDKRLISEFAAWLQKNREKPPKEQRGRNRRDDLNMLGGMRLLHRLRLEDAIVETVRALGEPLYGKRPSWARARQSALKVFQEDFLIDVARWKEPQIPLTYTKLERA